MKRHKHLYQLEQDYIYRVSRVAAPNIEGHELSLYNEEKNVRVTFYPQGKLRIHEGFQWDGCTPKCNFFDLFVLGTPDGRIDAYTGKPLLYYASLVHDALLAVRHHDLMPYSKDRIDAIFLEMMQAKGFALAKVYYWFVVNVGNFCSTIEDLMNAKY